MRAVTKSLDLKRRDKGPQPIVKRTSSDKRLSTGGDETEYEVKDIIGWEERTGGETWFWIKWKGYSHPTWVPEKNLTNCKESLERFYARVHSDRWVIGCFHYCNYRHVKPTFDSKRKPTMIAKFVQDIGYVPEPYGD